MKILALIGAWFEAFRNKLDLPFRRFEMASTSSATSLTIDVPEINELPSNPDTKEEDVITAFKLEMKELKEAMMIELESIEIGGKVRISKQLVALGFCLPALVMFGLAIKEAEQRLELMEPSLVRHLLAGYWELDVFRHSLLNGDMYKLSLLKVVAHRIFAAWILSVWPLAPITKVHKWVLTATGSPNGI
ncbi:hypothetical protein ZIOFF_064775 [Zingiber officinale]|uniref:DUF7796 domain-containing protein n=1 Tax=Zingiber officinale TaxID=94328 RepID=A0A8J5KGL8_ZINOF|nr:hypothetical protein ZIOFF_064775 [Zingiber officinale]